MTTRPMNNAERTMLATALLWRQRANLLEQVVDCVRKYGADAVHMNHHVLLALEHNKHELQAAGETP